MNDIIVNLIKKTIFKQYPEIESVTVEDEERYLTLSYDELRKQRSLGEGGIKDYYISFTIEPDEVLSVNKRNKIREEINMFFKMLGINEKSRIYVFFKENIRKVKDGNEDSGPELI